MKTQAFQSGPPMLPDFSAPEPAPPAAPALCLPVGVGIGKSSTARETIAAALHDGNMEAPIVYSVPTHALGREQVDAFAALGITAALWRGRRGEEDDAAPETVTCFDMEAVRDAQSVGADAQTAVCKSKAGQCAHFDGCPYQTQKAGVRAADVVVVPHSSLFHRKPAATRAPSMLVIDEGFAETRDVRIGLDVIGALNAAGDPASSEGGAYLTPTRRRLALALRATEPGGCLSLETLRDVGLTAAAAREAARLEWSRKVEPALVPGMSAADRAAAVEDARGNASIIPMAAIWRLVADGLENRHDPAGVTVEWRKASSGERYLVARARWRAEIKTGWSDGVPILHMDATLQRDIVSLFLPGCEVADPVEALTPRMTVRQVLGAPVTQRKILPGASARKKDRTTAANHLRDLHAFIRLRSMALRDRGAAGGPDVLVIGQKQAIEALRQLGLPDNVDGVWFNALAGRDCWKGVAGLIVLGRTLPPPRVVEDMAVALTNRPPIARPDHQWWYDAEDRGVRMADGTGRAVRVSVHPDPVCEAVRWSICEGELIQAIGRGRGVNRGPDDPLEVDLLADVCLPLTVTELRDWAHARPTREQVMVSRGVWLASAADRAQAYPDLWPSCKAAQADRQRSGAPRNAIIPNSFAPVLYRPAGQGQKFRQAAFDLAIVADPKAWLTEHVGPLAEYTAFPAPTD